MNYCKFAGYSSDSLAERMLDSRAKVLITTDGVWRGPKFLLLKTICDEAMNKVRAQGHEIESCIVVSHLRRLANPHGETLDGSRNTNGINGANNDSSNICWEDNRDCWWHDEMEAAEDSCYPVWLAAEDPLFILYTRYNINKKNIFSKKN